MPDLPANAVVDAHAHVFRAVSRGYPRAVHALSPPGRAVLADELGARMRAAGVERAVLIAMSPDDRYAGECARREPERFAAVGVYDPHRPVPGQVDEALADGLCALRMEALGDPSESVVARLASFAVLERMAELGMAAWFYGSLDQLRLLGRVLERLPSLVAVVNHLGFCPGATGAASLPIVLALARLPNAFVVLSGEYAFSTEPYPHADVGSRTRAVYEAFGAARLMRGSDFPWIDGDPGYGATFALLDHQLPGVAAGERAAIAGGTSLRLLWPGYGARV